MAGQGLPFVAFAAAIGKLVTDGPASAMTITAQPRVNDDANLCQRHRNLSTLTCHDALTTPVTTHQPSGVPGRATMTQTSYSIAHRYCASVDGLSFTTLPSRIPSQYRGKAAS